MWRWVADRKQVRRPPDEASPHAPHLQADPIEPATGEPARREPWLNLPPRFSAHPAAERLVNVLADQRQRMAGAAQHLSPVKTAASWLRPQRPILALAMTGAGAVG